MSMTRHIYYFFGAAFVFSLFVAVPGALAIHPFSPTYKRVSQVIDKADALQQKVENELLATADDAEYFTGRQMLIMTIPSFGRWRPHIYALSIGKAMKFGLEKSGVMLIVSKDGTAHIGVGPGLERLINGRIIQNIILHEIDPSLKKGDVQQAVRKGVDALADALDGSYKTPAEKRKQYLPFAILLPVLILMKLLFGRGQGRNFFGGGSWKRW